MSTPELSNERIEKLALLEPELAKAHTALIDRLQAINGTVAEGCRKAECGGVLRTNPEFHQTLYLRAQAPAMLAMVETVWLQPGPTMSPGCDWRCGRM